MKYYIIDDDIAIVKTLENIIEDRNIGKVIGSNTNALVAIEEIQEYHPDIVIVDFLMKEIDGVSLIEQIKAVMPDITFIMLSKVSEKTLIQKAYNAGVEFFISKPINIIEIEQVTNNVAEKLNLKRTVNTILNDLGVTSGFGSNQAVRTPAPKKTQTGIEMIISALGMMGEKGTDDIMSIFDYMENHNCKYSKEILYKVAEANGDTFKNVEQRIRRAIKKGLRNAASIKLEYPDSDVSVIYAGYVFDHLTLKMEMNNLEGISPTGGRVNISKFMDGLVLYKEYIK